MKESFHADVIIIGHGLAGLVAAHEVTRKGKKVIIVDQETEANLGGQAFWSFGGLFFINSPEQRRMGIKDSYELGYRDWMGTAGFHREEDFWPKQWAEAYIKFASGEKYSYVKSLGIKMFPVVGWAERGDGSAQGHGNSVPRFHPAWGTGTGIVKPLAEKAYAAQKKGLLKFAFRHKVTGIIIEQGRAAGVRGNILEEDSSARGVKTNRNIVGSFELRAPNVVIASGGIGANSEMVRQNWPQRLGKPPEKMVCGVPDYVDGSMISVALDAGAKIINRDRMWHYTEGVENWNPIWSNHGIRILPGPSSIWLDQFGNRLPAPYYPGFDTLGTLQHLMKNGSQYSWFITTQSIVKKEFALSGSEQNPDITDRNYRLLLSRLGGKKAPAPVEAFKEKGTDFIVSDNLEELVQKMNSLAGSTHLVFREIERIVKDRDLQLENNFGKDTQVNYMRSTRKYIGDRLIRTAKPHRILDPAHGPLIAVRLNILTRKTLGGIQTDLDGRAFSADEKIIEGLYAAGEAAGFGGGGVHGYRALEGTFLGGCIFSGKKVGEHIALQ